MTESLIPKNRWHRYFWHMTNVVASNSQCLSVKIGAVIVKDNVVVSTGYNGPPRGLPRCDERYGRDDLLDRYVSKSMDPQPALRERVGVCPRYALGFSSSELLDLCPAAHAEANAIASAARLGVSVKNAVMFVNCQVPCKNCLALIINSGISKVVCRRLDNYDRLSSYIIQHSDLVIQTYV
jgi:dCMP deaminase